MGIINTVIGWFTKKPIQEMNGLAKKTTEQVTTQVVNPAINESAAWRDEASLWRNMINRAVNNFNHSVVEFKQSTSEAFFYTGIGSFSGTLCREAVKRAGCSEKTQNIVEVATSSIAVATVMSTSLISKNNFSIQSLTKNFLCYFSLPLIQRGLAMGGYEAKSALGYAACLQTALSMYLRPEMSAFSGLGMFCGHYAGASISSTAAEGLTNVVFGRAR